MSFTQKQLKERQELIDKLTKRFGLRCWYCGLDLRGREIHIDHIIPKYTKTESSKKESNLSLACEFCNMAKFDHSLDVFMDWIEWLRSGNSFTPFNMTLDECEEANYNAKLDNKTNNTLNRAKKPVGARFHSKQLRGYKYD